MLSFCQGCTEPAISVFEASRAKGGPNAVWYAPGSTSPSPPPITLPTNTYLTEASNCGGVAVSGLEMAQNSARLVWTSSEVDVKLKGIMTECYKVRICPVFPSPSLLNLSVPLAMSRCRLEMDRGGIFRRVA